MQWFADELNRPDRHDYYIMRLISVMMSKPPKTLEELRIPFVVGGDSSRTFTREQAQTWAKARWLTAVGFFSYKQNRDKYQKST